MAIDIGVANRTRALRPGDVQHGQRKKEIES